MAETIYVLCGLLSAACAALLLRQHRQSATPLTFWSGVGFAGLAASNALLVLDLVILPTLDLAIWRSGIALVAVLAILFGFIMQTH
jgi:hypothetical protein